MAPTRGQAKDIMWDQLKSRVMQLKWWHDINETELSIRFANKSRIILKSAESASRIRGLGLDTIILDEFSEYDNGFRIWSEDIRPALSDKNGDAIFTMTPKGFNDGHDLYQKAKVEQNWAAFRFRTIDSPFFQTPDGLLEIEEAKRNLSERDFRQEYEASFENYSGRIYGSFDRLKNHVDYEYNKSLPIIVGQDFNRSPMASCFFQRVGKQLIQFGELFLEASSTEEMCRVVKSKFPNNTIVFRPDATGKRVTSNSSKSDFQIIKEFGFEIESGNINPLRVDRWAACNRAYEKGLVMVNTKSCPITTRELERISYKEGTCEPKVGPMEGHITDAHSYPIAKEFPIINNKVTVKSYA
jgi:hypothetical protein